MLSANNSLDHITQEISDLHDEEDRYVLQHLLPFYVRITHELNEIHQIKELMEDVLICCWYNLPNLDQVDRPVAEQLIQLVINCGTWHFRLGFKNEWFPAIQHAYDLCRRHHLTYQMGAIETLISQYQADMNVDEALQWAWQAVESTRTLEEKLYLAKAISQTVELLLYRHKPHDAMELINGIGASIKPEMVDAYFVLSIQKIQVLRRLGQIRDAIQLIEYWDHQVIDETLRITLKEKIVWYHISGLILCWGASEYHKAIEQLVKAQELYLQAQDYMSALGVMCDIGIAYWSMGEISQASDMLYDVYHRTVDYNLPSLRMVTIGNIGLVKIAQRDFDEALFLISKHYNLAKQQEHVREVNRSLSNLGIVHMHLGQFETAIDHLEQGINEIGVNNTASTSAYIALSRCYNKQNNRSKAQEIAHKALDFARTIDSPAHIMGALRILGECSPAEDAEPLFKEALGMAKDRKYMDEAACYLWLSHLTDDPDEQMTLWNQGKAILERVGAEAWLEGHSPQNPPMIPPP